MTEKTIQLQIIVFYTFFFFFFLLIYYCLGNFCEDEPKMRFKITQLFFTQRH